jgi:hypothetical protein
MGRAAVRAAFSTTCTASGAGPTNSSLDVYIPAAATPAATIYGFAMALGILGQKMKEHHIQGEMSALPRHPQVPLELRVEIERIPPHSRVPYGQQIAEKFFEMSRAT